MARVRLVALAACVLTLGACATVSVVPSRLGAVKKVAIVGYLGLVNLQSEDEPSNNVGSTITAIKSLHELGTGELGQRYTAEAESAYDSLATKLGKKFGWTVMTRQALAANPQYAKDVSAAGTPSTLTGMRAVPGVLTEYQAEHLSANDRAALCRSLGVDALILAEADYEVGRTSGFAIGGLGKVTKYPQATVSLTVYTGGDEKAAWKDRGARGDPAAVGVANVTGVQIDADEAKALQEATDSALGILLSRYDHANAKASAPTGH